MNACFPGGQNASCCQGQFLIIQDRERELNTKFNLAVKVDHHPNKKEKLLYHTQLLN